MMIAVGWISFLWQRTEAIRVSREVAQRESAAYCNQGDHEPCKQTEYAMRQARAAETSADAAIWQLWLNVAGLLGLGATVLYARRAWAQSARSADAAHAALRHAEVATEAQLRPYLYLTKSDRAAIPPRAVLLTDSFYVLLKNYGQTPARKIRLRFGQCNAQRPIGGVEVRITWEDETKWVALPDIPPGGTREIEFFLRDLAPPLIAAIRGEGNTVMLARIIVEYSYSATGTERVDETIVVNEEAVLTGKMVMLSVRERAATQ